MCTLEKAASGIGRIPEPILSSRDSPIFAFLITKTFYLPRILTLNRILEETLCDSIFADING